MKASQDKRDALDTLYNVVSGEMHEGEAPELVAKVLFEHLRRRLADGHSQAELTRKQARKEVQRLVSTTSNKTFNSALSAFANWLNKSQETLLSDHPYLRPAVESLADKAIRDSAIPSGLDPDGVACVRAEIDGSSHLVFVLLRTMRYRIHIAVAFQPLEHDAPPRDLATRVSDRRISLPPQEGTTTDFSKTIPHTCTSGSDERGWLKARLAASATAEDTSDLVLAWIDVNPSFRADDARTFLLHEAAGLLKMSVESVYDVYGQHDMLVKLRGDVAENAVLTTLQREMGQRGFLGPHKGLSYADPPTVLDVVKEQAALAAPDARRIICGIIAFIYLSNIPAAHVDDAAELVRGVVQNAPMAELIGLFQTNRDLVAEVYLACGGYYDLGRAVFDIERHLRSINYNAKLTTLLAMSVSEPNDSIAVQANHAQDERMR